MTSPTAKKQPASQLETTALLEQAAASLHYQNQQLKRTLWAVAMSAGGQLIVNEETVDLLWRLGFDRTPEGLLKVSATKIPDANPADIERMASDLRGTNGTISDYAEAHERLKEYPLQYIELALMPHIRFDGQRWITAEEFAAKPQQ
jgi:hypothetical protein